jgi:hypothetical protein
MKLGIFSSDDGQTWSEGQSHRYDSGAQRQSRAGRVRCVFGEAQGSMGALLCV